MNKISKFKKILFTAMLLAGFQQVAISKEITVSAAASLTDAFKEIAQNYEKKYPEDKIQLNFGASGSLLQQIDKGAPVDVFASADQQTMDTAQQKGLVDQSTRKDFVRNNLVLIVPKNSRLKITGLIDLTKKEVSRIALGNPASVPVGRYSKSALEQQNAWTGIEGKVINTQNVRQSLDYVARGEVDAGFVYGTDAEIMKDKIRVAYVVPVKQPVTYPIALIKSSKNAQEAKRFIQYVLSPAGQSVLAKYGFKKP